MAKIPIYIPTFISSVNFDPTTIYPRVYFYNGKIDCEDYYFIDGTNYANKLSSFPYVDHYNVVNGSFPTSDSESLLFQNENPVYGVSPAETLYSKYWEKYISLLYNPRTRLINCKGLIPLAAYFKIELNDIVNFRGNMFHLRAINNYDLKTGKCDIQLLGPIIPDALSAIPIPSVTFDISTDCTGVSPTSGKINITNIQYAGTDTYVGYSTTLGDPATYATISIGSATSYTFDNVPNYAGSYHVYVYNNTTAVGSVESLADNAIDCPILTNGFTNGGASDYGLILFGSGTGPGSNDWHDVGTMTITSAGVGSAIYEFTKQGFPDAWTSSFVITPADAIYTLKVRCRSASSTNLQAGIKFTLTNKPGSTLAVTLPTPPPGDDYLHIIGSDTTEYYHNVCIGQNTSVVQTTVDSTQGAGNCDGLETGGRTGLKVGGYALQVGLGT